jgi:hypothetical protein
MFFCTHHCHAKAISIKYSLCVSVASHPADKAHTSYHIVICCLSGSKGKGRGKVTLEQATKAQRGRRGRALFFP